MDVSAIKKRLAQLGVLKIPYWNTKAFNCFRPMFPYLLQVEYFRTSSPELWLGYVQKLKVKIFCLALFVEPELDWDIKRMIYSSSLTCSKTLLGAGKVLYQYRFGAQNRQVDL
jgi:hypothetical protein